MEIAAIDSRAVKQALRALRYAEALGDCPLLEMAALEVRLRQRGQPNTAEGRAAELFALLAEAVWECLRAARDPDRASEDREPSPERAREEMQRDFRDGNVPLEAWSALHHRYIVDLGAREAELAESLGISYRTLARRLQRGHELLARHLRDEELGAATALLARPGRLPSTFNRFIGRAREVDALRQLVTRHRLVTLTGPGGIGKTRLAVEVGRLIEHDYADGATYVDLTRLTEPLLVPAALAGSVGVPLDPQRSLLGAVCEHLRSSHRLIVLDNCEHVLQATASLVSELLSRCPELHVLATSRELLHIPGEQVFVTRPLAVPGAPRGEADGGSPRTAAVRLFEDRAAATLPGFRVTEANAGAVARLCRRLDGLPLALELAAHSINVQSAHQIAAHLDDRLGLLPNDGAGGDQRHSTLRATLDWSFDLLTDRERRLFRRLAVFAGGEDLTGITAVCADHEITSAGDAQAIGPRSVVDLLASLIGKSLLVAERDPARARRYRCLRTVREYARDRLRESGEEARYRRRHAAYFAELAEALEPELSGSDQSHALQTLAMEHDNIRRALGWALEVPDAELALRLAGTMARFWELQGHVEEGRRWLEEARRVGGADARKGLRAKVLSGAGALAEEQGDLAAARALHRESLAIRREVGDDAGIAESLNNLGNVLNMQADYRAAREYHRDALEIRRRLGDAWGVAVSLNNLGNVAQHLGDHGEARDFYARSAAAFRELGDRWALSAALNNLGVVASDQGDHGTAREHLQESLAIARALGDRQGQAYALHNLGDVALGKGRVDDAHALQAESLSIAHEVGDRQGVAESLESLAALAHRRRDAVRAAELLGAAQALREQIGAPWSAGEESEMDTLIGDLRQALGERHFAEAWAAGHSMPEEEARARALAS